MEYRFTEELRVVPPYKPTVLGCLVQLFLIVTILGFIALVTWGVLYMGSKVTSESYENDKRTFDTAAGKSAPRYNKG